MLLLPFVSFAKSNTVTEPSAYLKTKMLWTSAYAELSVDSSVVPGITFIGPIAGNGTLDRSHKNKKRDTIIYAPETIDLNKSVDIVMWFHGLNGFATRTFKTRVLSHTNFLTRAQGNYIIIVPEMPWSRNTYTTHSRQGRVFTRSGQYSTFFDSCIKKINAVLGHDPTKFKVGTVILVGHSAGGSTLKSISRSGGLDWLYSHRHAEAVRIIFSDAGYGQWTDITWKNFKMRSAPKTEFILLTRRWDRPYNNTVRFLKKFKKIPSNIKHEVFNRKNITHGQIGDQALSWAYMYAPVCCEQNE